MAAATPQLSSILGLLATCTRTRRVRLPARTFQLLAKSSSTLTKAARPESSRGELRSTEQSENKSKPLPVNENPFIPQPKETEHASEESFEQLWEGKDGRRVPPFFTHETWRFTEHMRMVTQPVVVITSTDTSIDPKGDPQAWRGATVSSFTSVAIDPHPYVSFNITKHSSTYTAIQNSKFFAVHLLGRSSDAISIAKTFSGGNQSQPFFTSRTTREGVKDFASFVSEKQDWNRNSNITSTTALPPRFRWSSKRDPKMVLFQMLCAFEQDKCVEVGDHAIIVGRTIDVYGNRKHVPRELDDVGKPQSTKCLTYAHSRYNKKEPPRQKPLPPPPELENFFKQIEQVNGRSRDSQTSKFLDSIIQVELMKLGNSRATSSASEHTGHQTSEK